MLTSVLLAYIERIRDLRGFMYYGLSVDRVLGVVATRAGDWHMAEQAFEDGLALCRRANNQPEEGMILYEQARADLMQSGTQAANRAAGRCAVSAGAYTVFTVRYAAFR